MSALKVILAVGAFACSAGATFAADMLDASQGAKGPEAPKAYVGAFCGPVALSDSGAGPLMEHLGQWKAKAGNAPDADAARPADSDAPGQLFRFSDPAAPLAFIDRRRGACTLIYPAARTPQTVLDELATETLPVNDKGPPAPWHRVNRIHFGPPGPIRYFLKVGETDGFGLCSTIFEDLRLRDGSPVTMVRVSTCRLAPDEKLDNG